MSHTPTPWFAEPCPIPSNRAQWRVRINDESVVLTSKDNAKIIAAAPDLLAACQELLADKYLADPINANRMASLRAAVAKASP